MVATLIPRAYPCLLGLVERQLAVFPDHADFLRRRFSDVDSNALVFAEGIAEKVTQIAGERIDRVCDDYRWLSLVVLEEELHFRRHGCYRLSSFEQANQQVYSNPDYMRRYMNGLLISQLWWRNHTDTLQFFRDAFIRRNPVDARHLEIGPGHGLLLYLAMQSHPSASTEAWDISDSSLEQTRDALDAMRMPSLVALKKVNLFDAPPAKFGSVVFSEVLEHLEQPQRALQILRDLLSEDGRMFLNVPVNSPAPDHIYLFETPEDVFGMIADAGLMVERSHLSPATGATLERARKMKLTISVSVIVRRS
jgi:2-polyprenyl-3-methyl-5-hydroxy-6-metoxy-1,4-benzoquinol methylase